MSEQGVAYRYAKPLLDMSIEQGALEEVNQDMLGVIQLCKENSQLVAVLKNPIIREHKKEKILNALFKDKSHKLTIDLIVLLADKNREGFIEAIAEEFNRMYNTLQNIQKVQFTSTIGLDESTRTSLKDKLTKTTGKKIILEERIDESLLGGFILKIGDNQIDNSIKNSLQRLKNKFANTI